MFIRPILIGKVANFEAFLLRESKYPSDYLGVGLVVVAAWRWD
jgi:hypothetical protein